MHGAGYLYLFLFLRVKYVMRYKFIFVCWKSTNIFTVDRSQFRPLKQSKRYIPPPNGNSWQYLSNPAALLYTAVAETHGGDWQNVRRIKCAESNHVVPVNRGF
jgi:hypothetical protein